MCSAVADVEVASITCPDPCIVRRTSLGVSMRESSESDCRSLDDAECMLDNGSCSGGKKLVRLPCSSPGACRAWNNFLSFMYHDYGIVYEPQCLLGLPCGGETSNRVL